MAKSKRIILGALAVMGISIGAGLLLVDVGVLSTSLKKLEATYATPASKFIEVDGIRLHYMDEGEGPAVLLLHASFMNLRTWDSMAAQLATQFRVVRPDFLISGLTGPEPDDAYSFERNQELVLGLMNQLEIDSFAVVGTSSGGIVSFRLAAEHPERVNRLVLINSAGMPRTAATNPNRVSQMGGIGAWLRARYMSRDMVRQTLDLNFIEPNEPPQWLVDMNYDLWRRDDRREAGAAQMRNFRTGDPQTKLNGVVAPTLILWGMDNATVMHLEADVFQHWLTNAPTYLKKYPGVGHYLYLEIPDEVEADVEQFLTGNMDAQLISTKRRVGITNTKKTDAAPGARFKDCEDCPEMVVIPPGNFAMGFDGGEPERYEGPVQEITIKRKFAVGRTEISVGQYRNFTQATGYQAAQGCYIWDGKTATLNADGSWENAGTTYSAQDNEPAVCLAWTDAVAYVDWLEEKTGAAYRLLTEAEWEYAADAGSFADFPWGADPLAACEHANVFDLDAAAADIDSPLTAVKCSDGHAGIAPVGSYAPNAFGLQDMVGNIWEWTADCYVMPRPTIPNDGSAVVVDQCDRRSVKGGSWITRIDRQRPTFRGRDPENLISRVFGFRIARDLY
jgi:formylglycine-generating enzyme required for sulfatase activity/pimeloyl-ACP methyl ester carboxylesterase